MVNLKNMVSKVKAALTGAEAVGADNMEAQVLQALQNQDFEAIGGRSARLCAENRGVFAPRGCGDRGV